MKGGKQILNIVDWDIQRTIAHEIAHALGAIHEHQRPDRDNFVVIQYQNIDPSLTERQKEVNFGLKLKVLIQSPYDYYSVMHYKHDAYSKPYVYDPNNPSAGTASTIIPVPQTPPVDKTKLGTYAAPFGLTPYDKSGMAGVYGPVIDNVNPTAYFTSPSINNSTVNTLQPIMGIAQDNLEIAQVRLSIGRASDGLYWTGSYWGPRTELPTSLGNPGSGNTSWAYNGLSSINLTSGGYVLTARVFDKAGNFIDVSLSVNVSVASAPWSAIDSATGSDNRSRQVWQRSDGRVELWTVSNTGVKQSTGPVYAFAL